MVTDVKKIGIINVNIQYEIPKKYWGNPELYLENVELPKEYVEDSYHFVKVVEEERVRK